MLQTARTLVLVSFLIFVFTPTSAAKEGESKDIPIDVIGKVKDHHHFSTAFGNIPLPRILLVNGEWYFFASTHAAVKSGKFIEENHELKYAGNNEITLDLSFTSHLIYFWISIGLTLLISMYMAQRYKKGVGRKTEPTGWFHNLFELTFVFIRDDIAKTNISDDKYQKFVPYLFSVFVAITFMDLMGLLPWGAIATADITVTGVLAAFTFFITQWNGTKDHWEHVFWFPGVSPFMRIILTPIEILGLFTKPLALAVRLFANMLSGKIMIICILGLIFIFAEIFGSVFGLSSSIFIVPLTVALYILKAFVGILQAYIFTLLSAVFIGMAAEEHEQYDEGVEAHA